MSRGARGIGRLVLVAAVAALALPLCAATPARSQDGSESGQPFREWLAYCDDYQNCTAETFESEGAHSDNLLLLERRSDRHDWIVSVLTTATIRSLPAGAVAMVDGTSEVRFSGSDIAISDIRPEGLLYSTKLRLAGGRAAQAMLNQLLPGGYAVIGFTDAENIRHRPHFSLAGMSAALRWINQRQGRVGERHFAAASVTDSTAALPAELAELHRGLDFCLHLSDLQHGEDIIMARDLGDGTSLHIVPCAGAGFNLAYVVYHDVGEEISQLQFVSYSDEESWTSTPYIFNAEWDAKSRTLKSFLKGRSLGDCGSAGEWRYGPSGLRLEKYFYKGDCDGTITPGQLPLLFEAKHAP